jgi:hypothetical protein
MRSFFNYAGYHIASDARRQSGLAGRLAAWARTAYDWIYCGDFAGISIKQKPIGFEFYEIGAGPAAVEIFLINVLDSLSVQPLNGLAHKRIPAAEKINRRVNNGAENISHRVIYQVHIRHCLISYVNIFNLLK